jgi:hypothetical protein
MIGQLFSPDFKSFLELVQGSSSYCKLTSIRDKVTPMGRDSTANSILVKVISRLFAANKWLFRVAAREGMFFTGSRQVKGMVRDVFRRD